ncbi:flagellar brake protein [Methylomonas sp. AM2-LC]|uniref:flagellar brake protein n=1 Tax=Methylomonas sp. AM2-LC TaxID=3153301 RepID=UPI0032651AA8
MKNETDYLISHPKQVVNHLTELMTKKCIISAQFGDHNLSFLTVLLEIDAKAKEIKLDCAPNEQLNNQLLNAVKVLFRTEYEGIKVSFRGHKIKKSVLDGSPVLSMPLPDAIFWLQRRNFYRVKIPHFHTGSFCRISLSLENAENETFIDTQDFKLLDLGIRGFSILVTNTALESKFTPDSEAMTCNLYLHERSSGSLSFIVKYIKQVKTSPTTNGLRLGCLLTDIPPAFESVMQLYMQDIERQLKGVGQ